jgi:DNA invertase Pin-like site-specific DNA recombinase
LTSENGIKRAAIYARISNDPEGKAIGVTDQAKRCRELADLRGWQIAGPGCDCGDCAKFRVPADVYCDNDITASGKKRRPHYERLLADIEAGRFDVVVTVHTDRLHRNLTELEGYIKVCEPRKVETHTVKAGELDLTTSSGRAMAAMLGVFARHELERMVERQKAAKQRNRDAGLRWSGTRPFGYALDGNAETGLIPIEREAAAIRDACAKVLAGMNLSAIAREWNKAGLRTPERVTRNGVRGGNPWDSIGVGRVLIRALNAGLVEHVPTWRDGKSAGGPQVTGQGKWEPVISEDTWRAVKAILSDDSRRTSPGPKPQHLLTGILICGVCGCRRFRAIRNTPGGPFTYRCASKVYDPLNPASGWHLSRDAAMLDEFVEWVIAEKLSRPDVVAALNTQPPVDIPALDARRTAINAELEEWARMPGITPRQLQIKNGPLLAELSDVERQISDGLRGDPLPEFAGREPAKVWDGLGMERRRAVAAMLLRVKLQPVGRRGRPPKGWRVGDSWMLNDEAVQILPPNA